MDARQKMRREGRWIPAFAGMTLGQGLTADLETKKRNPTAPPPRHPREGGDPCLFLGQKAPGRGVNTVIVPEKHKPTALPPRHPREGGDPCLSPDHETPWPKPGGKKP